MPERTLRACQREVDEWINTIGVRYFSELTNTAVLMEEVGELAAALREGDRSATAAEFADVLAWLATIANVSGIDLERAVVEKYGSGCPGCGEMVCGCDDAAKP